MKRGKYIFAAGVVSAAMAMAMSIPVYADRSGKVELPQDSTDYYMTVDSGGVGVDIYPETSGKSEKLNDKTVEDGTVLHIEGETEYSRAMKSHFRKFGNQMSGSGNHLCNYASLLA